jgi:DNA repair protein REV1
MLPFKLAAEDSKKGQFDAAPEIFVQPPSSQGIGDDLDVPMEDVEPTNASVPAPGDLPAFSQVDMSVFNALPADVRQELENEYQRRSASPNKAGPAPAYPLPAPAPARRSALAPPGVFPHRPQRFTVRGTNFKRVARQLAPRNRPSVSPYKSWLLNKPKRRAGEAKLSEATLREYGFDPEVFRALPPNVQHEQLAMVRIIKARGSIPSPPSQRKELKPRKRKPIPPHLLWRAPAPKARWVHPPILKQQGATKKEKLSFTETDDIQDVLEKWVNAYRRWAPKQDDVEFFTKYLLESVDGRRYTDVGVARAVAIMKWWLVLLRRYWGGSELIEEEDQIDPSEIDPVGEAWWKTFRIVKEKMEVWGAVVAEVKVFWDERCRLTLLSFIGEC